MKVFNVSGYYTTAEAGVKKHVQARTIRDRIRQGKDAWVKVDGIKFVYIHPGKSSEFPPGVNAGMLEWVNRCARRNKIISERIYEQIILGNISAVTLGRHVFVIKNEPALLEFLSKAKKK